MSDFKIVNDGTIVFNNDRNIEKTEDKAKIVAAWKSRQNG